MTDLRRDYIRTQITRTDRITPERLDAIFGEMEAQAGADMAAERVAAGDIEIQRLADMRYLGQEHTVKVPLPAGAITAVLLAEINHRFHDLHEQAYTFRLETPIELVNYHVTAFGRVAKPEIQKVPAGGDVASAIKGRRRVNFDELGFHEAVIYERGKLPVGVAVPGPAVVEEPASTTVVFPDQQVRRDEYGNLHIEAVEPR
jgi:N-methylhydantoinase A